MITYTKENGCYFVREATEKHYHLYEAMTYKGHTTSDRIIIWDEDADQVVNFVYGANSISVDELDKMVSAYVEEYEAKKQTKPVAAAIRYNFTKTGCKAFCEDVVGEFFEAMDKDEDLSKYEIQVTFRKRTIKLPMFADLYEGMCYWFDNIEEDCFDAEEVGI